MKDNRLERYGRILGAMSQENAELIRRVVEIYNDHGFGATLGHFDDAAVFEEPPEQPGSTVAEGRDEVGRVFTQFDAAWEEHRSEPEEIRVIDSKRVLLLSVDHFRGRDGIEIVQPSGTVFTISGGRIVRMQAFWERENALEAAGLRE
jgi:ketosteroid isomerase-like protein